MTRVRFCILYDSAYICDRVRFCGSVFVKPVRGVYCREILLEIVELFSHASNMAIKALGITTVAEVRLHRWQLDSRCGDFPK